MIKLTVMNLTFFSLYPIESLFQTHSKISKQRKKMGTIVRMHYRNNYGLVTRCLLRISKTIYSVHLLPFSKEAPKLE